MKETRPERKSLPGATGLVVLFECTGLAPIGIARYRCIAHTATAIPRIVNPVASVTLLGLPGIISLLRRAAGEHRHQKNVMNNVRMLRS